MPQLRHGRILAGVGGAQGLISIHGVVPDALRHVWGGGAEDLDGDAILFSGAAIRDEWGLFTYRPSTGALTRLRKPDGSFYPGAGISAYAGVWGARNSDGYFDSLGRTHATWGHPLVIANKVIITHRNPWADTADLIAIDRDGTERVLVPMIPNPDAVFACCEIVLWQYKGRLHAVGADDPIVAPGAAINGCLFAARGLDRWIITYYTIGGREIGLVTHPWDNPTRAILISDDGHDFRPSAEFQDGSGHLWIVTAEGQAELPHEIRCWELDLNAGVRRLVYPGRGVTGPWQPIEFVDLTKIGAPDLPDPPDPPDPPDDDMPTDDQIILLHIALTIERGKYPATITPAECGLILNAANWRVREHGFGLSTKLSGNRVPTPQGVDAAYDISHHRTSDSIWDCATGESTKMLITEPHLAEHHDDPDRPWLAPIDPGTPAPPPPPPPTFDKEKVKAEAINDGVEYTVRIVPTLDPQEVWHGVNQFWDKFPPDYLPSTIELGCGGICRTGPEVISDEDLNKHHGWALASTARIRAKAGYVCGGGSSTPQPGDPKLIERIRVNGVRFETESGKPWGWIGCTSFDLPFHIGKRGDASWADWLAEQGFFTVARIVPATVYRNPRTLAEGLTWLPKTLDALQQRGLWAEVTVLVDTSFDDDQFGMDGDAMRAYMLEIGAACAMFQNVAGIEIGNENGHEGNQNHLLLTDPGFLAELRELLPEHIPVSWGSHGGDQPLIDGGDYITIHEARGASPEANATEWSIYQRDRNIPVVRDEPIGVAEVAIPGKRTNDPDYGARLGRSTREQGIAGATLHLDAGMFADVSKLGPIQIANARGFVRAMTE